MPPQCFTIRSHPLLASLITHQLGYFDILPLYVVLMVMAPALALIDRYAPGRRQN